LNRAVRQCVAEELAGSVAAIPGLHPELPESFHVNGAGNFEVGGPEGDNGLSGKKLVVDAYGPRVPIGGGALSGKDFFKADRAGAVLARRLAKAVVMSGAAPECTATLAIAPGDREFRIVSLVGTSGDIEPRRWAGLIDLSLVKAGESYTGTPGLPELARYGHFTSPDRRWERIEF
jgi:S-adenosylmethionine synthetase